MTENNGVQRRRVLKSLGIASSGAIGIASQSVEVVEATSGEYDLGKVQLIEAKVEYDGNYSVPRMSGNGLPMYVVDEKEAG